MLIQPGLHLLSRREQAGFHRFLGQLQDSADVLVAAVAKVAQNNDRPVLLGQFHQCSLHLIAKLRCCGRLLRRDCVGFR